MVPATLVGIVLASLPAILGSFGPSAEAGLAEALSRAELVASVVAHDVARLAGGEPPRAVHLDTAASRLPAGAQTPQTSLILFDRSGTVLAAVPPVARFRRHRSEIIEDGQPLTIFADRAGAMRTKLADGTEVIAALRNLPHGQVALLQPFAELSETSSGWMSPRPVMAFVAVLGVLGLGGACAAHARGARAARQVCARMHRRVETSLSRGRCGLWDWDVSRGRVYWSASMYGLLGYQQRDEYLCFGEVNGMIHPGDGDLYAVAERIAAAETSHIEHDFRMRTADGLWLWLRARAEVITEPEDGSKHLVGIAVDITDERGFVERKRAADMRLHDAVEAISEAFVLWDSENRLVLCNSKFRKFHELPAEAVTPGATYAEIIAAGRPPLVASHVTRENPDDAGAPTLEAQLSDGRWLQISERRTKDGGFVSVGTDITALKRHEEKLLDSERQLIGTVADLKRSRLTLQVQAQQLAELAEHYHEQKAQAENANRAKTDFLAKMSHELRTPLNAVIGFAEVMERQMFGPLGNERYLGYATHIRGSGIKLLRVINDILQISRIEAGHVTLSTTPIAVTDLIDSAIESVRDEAQQKGIEIATSVPALGAVQADERALRQVVVSLLQNSVKFTPRGGSIRVRVARAGAATNIFVEDSGVGIPREFLSRVGRPFEQIEPEFNRACAGAGLGLAIARALTEMHGGRLRIRSQQGVGTVVLLHLPIAASEGEETNSAVPPEDGPVRLLQAAE